MREAGRLVSFVIPAEAGIQKPGQHRCLGFNQSAPLDPGFRRDDEQKTIYTTVRAVLSDLHTIALFSRPGMRHVMSP